MSDRKRVLLVDDEPNVLSAYRRSLGRTFDVVTFERPSDAIDELSRGVVYPVIVTDMRMPVMDGLQFVAAAREVSPHSVFAMLTGNADQQTAIDAINMGQVFRFLNKPCDGELLKDCINTCLRQFELQQGERELLRDTLTGSIKLMVEVVAISDPSLARVSTAVRATTASLLHELGEEKCVEVSVAASFALIGLLAFSSGVGEHDRFSDRILAEAAESGKRLLCNIPRLAQVAQMVGSQRLAGELPSEVNADTVVAFGGRVLCFVIDWHTLTTKCGGDQARGLEELQSREGRYDPRLLEAAGRMIAADQSTTDDRSAHTMLAVDPRALAADDLLQEAVSMPDGTVVLESDQILTTAMAERVRAFANLKLITNQTVRVLRPVCSGQIGDAA